MREGREIGESETISSSHEDKIDGQPHLCKVPQAYAT